MLSKEVKIINKLGLHARASMKLVDIAAGFSCTIHIEYKNRQIDAKDILDVMTLGAGQGSILLIKTSGEDEANAMSAITKLINNRFDESE